MSNTKATTAHLSMGRASALLLPLVLMLALSCVLPQTQAAGAVGRASRRKLQGSTAASGSAGSNKHVPNCFMVQTTVAAAATVPRSRRLASAMSASVAEHATKVMHEAQLAIGLESVASFRPLGAVFPGMSVRTSSAAASNRLMDFMDEHPEVKGYARCTSIPRVKPVSTSSNGVDLPPLGSVVDGIYQSSDGAEARSLPGYQDLWGQGIKVALIDSGIDWKHPGLGGCFGPGCKVVGGYDFTGDDDTVTSPDNDPMSCGTLGVNHGTAVSGIISTNYTMYYNETGADNVTRPGAVTFLGVAPQVDLLVYKVFSCNESKAEASDDIIAAAAQRAYEDGADVINLSLGADGAWGSSLTVLYNRLTKLGVVVVTAAGNAASKGLFQAAQMMTDPEDITHMMPIRVASTDDPRTWIGTGTITTDDNATYPDSYGVCRPSDLAPVLGVPLRLTTSMAKGLNVTADACNGTDIGDMKGYVALVKRGTCFYDEKVANLLRAGAIGIVIWNRLPEALGGVNGGTDEVPVLTMSGTSGDALSALVNQTMQAGTSATPISIKSMVSTDIVSFYTSWGPNPDLNLDPSLSAPGGEVFSLQAWTDPSLPAPTRYVSGTSFSSPYVAGCVALYLQAARAAGLDPSPKEVTNALMATAVPIPSNNAGISQPFRSGAGLINLAAALRALAAPVTVSPPVLLLPTGKSSINTKFSLTNTNPYTSVTYSLEHMGSKSILATNFANIVWDPEQSKYIGAEYVPEYGEGSLAVSFKGPGVKSGKGGVTVTVGPSATVTVKVMFAVPKILHNKGYLLSGYIRAILADDTESKSANLTLPYLSYSSAFSSIPVLKPDIPGGIFLPTYLDDYLTEEDLPFMVLVDGQGKLLPPYDEIFASDTVNGTKPLEPVYSNNMVPANMPTISVNIQHQFNEGKVYLVDVKSNVRYYVLDLGPETSALRSYDPAYLQIPTTYMDKSGFRLPIPSGLYATSWEFKRVRAVADLAIGREKVVTEKWVSPMFRLVTNATDYLG